MKFYLAFLVAFLCSLPSVPCLGQSSVADDSSSKKYLLHGRLGLTTDNQDRFINSDWEHETFQSPLLTVALFMRDRGTGTWRFLPGVGISAIRSLETLESSNGKAKIDSNYYALQVVGLVEFQPPSMGSLGLNLVGFGDVLGRREAELRADGFEKKLSSERTFPAISLSAGVFWKMDESTRFSFNLEQRPFIQSINFASHSIINGITLGVDHAL